MIYEQNLVFFLETKNTSYVFRINETNHPEQLYYGRKIRQTRHLEALLEKRTLSTGTSVSYDVEHPALSLDNLCLETSSYGKGDFRETQVVFARPFGDRVSDFVYKEHRILQGKPRSFSGLPESLGDASDCSTLVLTLIDKALPIKLELHYTVFDSCNTITRRTTLHNESPETLSLERFFSLQLDIHRSNFDLVTFDGAWARERYRNQRKITPGIIVNDSKSGLSSARHNPCVFLVASGQDEQSGDCFGCNLVYSSDHCETVETSPYGKTRLLCGLNPATFRWQILPGDTFHSPEAILTYSCEGIDGASRNFHAFVNNHIVRGPWKFRERPVLVNNWEGTYFDFDEKRLLSMARAAADLGVELFVLDDGWFGNREDDTSSLGDWTVNTRKLPGGLISLSAKVHAMGMLFGLWCEPEMVSKHSRLYEQHPDWLVCLPERQPSPSRNQYLLDITKPAVRDYLFEALSTVWKSAKVDYVKWDMNRPFSDMHSQDASFRQDEFNHRYILGLYELMGRFNVAFPDMLFESCASGGNRFDLGMLCFMSQTWVSDNTDALCRMAIQEGTSCGYPLSCMGAHVSASPNHQTLRRTFIESRFNVAAFGLLGYELDLTAISELDRQSIREQIAFYKVHRSLLQYGEFFRLNPFANGENHSIWAVSNPDKSEMLVLVFQRENIPNAGTDILRISIANPEATYAVTPRRERISLKMFGDLVNMVSPIRLREDSLIQRTAADRLSLENELEYYIVPGDILAYAGIKLNQQFSGRGYDKETRVIGDFGSRIYHLRSMK